MNGSFENSICQNANGIVRVVVKHEWDGKYISQHNFSFEDPKNEACENILTVGPGIRLFTRKESAKSRIPLLRGYTRSMFASGVCVYHMFCWTPKSWTNPTARVNRDWTEFGGKARSLRCS